MRAYWSGAPRWSRSPTWRGRYARPGGVARIPPDPSADVLMVPSLSLRRSRGMTCIFGESKTQWLQETQCSVSVKKNKIYSCGSVIAAVSQQLPDKSALSTETTSFSNKQYIIYGTFCAVCLVLFCVCSSSHAIFSFTSSLFYKSRLKSSNAAQQGLKEGWAALHPSVVLGCVAVFNSN